MFGIGKNKSAIVYLLLLFISAVFSYLLVTPGYFPYLGIGVFFIVLSSLVFVFKKEKSVNLWLLYGLTLLFSIFIFYRINSFLVFLNTVAVIYLGSILALGDKEDKNFYDLLISPLVVFFQSLKIKSIYKLELTGRIKQDQFNLEKLSGQISSIFITVLVLSVIVPLLSYSNPFFSKLITELVTDFFDIINLRKLAEILFRENFFIYLARILLFLVFALFIPRLLTYTNISLGKPSFLGLPLTINNLLIPKVVTGVVLIIFFITQTQLYFATEEVFNALGYSNAFGYSHSQYAREVFAHLSIVTLIIFSLIYFDRSKNYWSKLFTYLLIVEAIFLNFIALKSVYDYSSNWGFTQKRLYGYTGVVWIFGLFLLFLYKYHRDLKNSKFVKSMLFWSSFTLLAINIFNFDYIIYHYAKSTTHEGIDHYYLSRLSTDAQSYREHVQQLVSEVEKNDKADLRKIQAARTLLNKIEKLKSKYKNFDIRTVNFSEYFEYLRIKNLNLEIYKSVLGSKQFLPPTSPILPFGPINSITNAPKIVSIKIVNLDKHFYNHNFEIRNSESNKTLTRGSLDNDLLNHIYGLGKFSVIIYDYVTEENITKEIPAKELFYEVNEDEQNKDILFR